MNSFNITINNEHAILTYRFYKRHVVHLYNESEQELYVNRVVFFVEIQQQDKYYCGWTLTLPHQTLEFNSVDSIILNKNKFSIFSVTDGERIQ